MKRIAVITLHRATNFGSMLQTYATQLYLEKLGHQVEIIDFVPQGLSFRQALFPANSEASLIRKAVRLIPAFLCNSIQFAVVHRFVRRYIHVTPVRYSRYSDILRSIPKADIYLSGSDQVWNTQNNNHKEDIQAYYLNFVPDGYIKIAYAGSFGKTKLSEEEATEISHYLKRYWAIGVREDSALDLLKKLGIPNGMHVLDPTFLIEPEEWLKFLGNRRPPKPGYLMVYNLNRNKAISKYAREIAERKQLRIVNFADTYEFVPHAKNRLVNTAMDFINYIAHADYVITDSFHATAYSLSYSKDFICVSPPKYASRLESILRKTGLRDRIFYDEVDMNVALQPVDYDIVQNILSKEKNRSKEFLIKAIDGIVS